MKILLNEVSAFVKLLSRIASLKLVASSSGLNFGLLPEVVVVGTAPEAMSLANVSASIVVAKPFEMSAVSNS